MRISFFTISFSTQADPNIGDQSGITALHKATQQNKPNVISLLIKAGADPKIKDMYGKLPKDVIPGNNKELEKLLN